MTDNHYENDKLVAVYDLDSGWSVDRDFYLALANKPQMTILDVGCGTGLLCNKYAAQGHDVTGVDPSVAMLNSGRAKKHGNKVDWVHAFAQEFALNKLFDLIIMTGHAFQVLLTAEDVRATLNNMKNHLKQDGLIVFESRNPHIDWTNSWNYEMKIVLPDGGTVEESRHFISMTDNQMSFELRYQFHDELLKSESLLRFWTLQEIQSQLSAHGLFAEQVLGDWDGKEFNEKTSEEMIFLVRKQNGKGK
ncbi:MAG: class I SAM-dependent methyltransferase [Cyanobacteria bacterium SZAS-4]|nr:class I SAM-dependent methyltransferase [Cyanobacteria bacterium SZAS-4]